MSRNNENVITGDVHRDRTHDVDKKRNFIKPATIWSDFKSYFKVCAELNGWSVIKKEMYLAVFLRGNAQGVLGNLP